jgi:hypothetical protein
MRLDFTASLNFALRALHEEKNREIDDELSGE